MEFELECKSGWKLDEKLKATYLIAEILESESEKFTLRHPSHAKVEPRSQIPVGNVWRSICCDPYVEAVLDNALLCPCHVPAAKLAGEDNV